MKIFITFLVLITLSTKAFYNLCYTLEKAKSRTDYYAQKYGAVDPLFKTDDSGKVIWECWAAPPEGWTKRSIKFC